MVRLPKRLSLLPDFDDSMIPFEQAYYRWAKEQVDLEIKSNAALVRSLQTELGNRFLGVMQTLPRAEMGRTWKSILKRWHERAATAMGEPLSAADRAAVRQYEQLIDLSFAACEPESSDKPFVKRRGFQAAARSALEDLLKVRTEKLGGNLLRLVSRYRNCAVHTYLGAGSRYYQLCYWHNLVADNGEVLRERCSVLEWLAISSQTHWHDVSERSLQSVVASIVSSSKRITEFCEAQWHN